MKVKCHSRSVKFVFGPIESRYANNICALPPRLIIAEYMRERETWEAILAKYENEMTWQELVDCGFKVVMQYVDREGQFLPRGAA